MKFNSTLGEVASVMPCSYGGEIGVNEIELPVVKVSNVRYDGEFHKEFEIRSFTKVEANKLTVETGDLLVVKSSGSKSNILSGKTAICTEEHAGKLIASNFLMRLKIDQEQAWPRYIWYVLNSTLSKTFVKTIAGTTTYPNLKWPLYTKHPLPLPPLQEQKRIAAILDKADAVRLKRQQAIELADQFLQSVFLDMFGDPVTNPKGWKKCSFGNLTELITYGLTVRPDYCDEGIPLISAREIRSGKIGSNDAPKISSTDYGMLSNKAKPQKDDILFSKTGSIGHSAIIEFDNPIAITQNVARIVPNKSVCAPKFLFWLLRSNYFITLSRREAKGNAVKDLQLGIMKEFPVYMPPLAQQKKFGEIVSRQEKNTEGFEKSVESSDSLFNSLSQKAFKGELTKDETA